MLAAARIAGATRVVRAGGAQAIAALAYGTKTIPRVDKIVGPGNVYVATAKRLVFGQVDIDMIAGPTEVLIIADESARPDFVAADMLAQAEHDPEAAAICLTTSHAHARAVAAAVEAHPGTGATASGAADGTGSRLGADSDAIGELIRPLREDPGADQERPKREDDRPQKRPRVREPPLVDRSPDDLDHVVHGIEGEGPGEA